ncbi:universal stress protein [Asticcacaulis sp. 201]|uniref:universal stress protein n=1 Tax=Asticcacaulis sp. 201 TaxID=3028787 RepID=UPI002915D1B1|nr:universal stress protein [Asticcacaulis sp. 201]MDV6331244.1 universal stress protein [Asticcacaulis sp. 201]
MTLARQFTAEARFLHISAALDIYSEPYSLALYGLAISGDMDVGESIAQGNDARRNLAQDEVMAAAKAHGIPFCRRDCLGTAAPIAQAVFCPVTARAKDCIPAAGRLADLIVIARERADAHADLSGILCGLFDTARPVLVVPEQDGVVATPTYEAGAVIAWDGSLPATRALYNALPLLRNAKQIQVICIRNPKASSDFNRFDDIAHWLDLHSLPAHVARIESDAESVPETILRKALAFQAEYIVMGAYGHSHIGQMLLGGATNQILKHSAMPILLSH